LSRAYGRWAGFLFGWFQLAIVRPGDIAIMAFAFATYARTLYDPFASARIPCTQAVYACAAVILLTLVNILGVREGKWTQNGLATVKVLGILAIVGVAALAPQSSASAPSFDPQPFDPQPFDPQPFSLALIFVLFCFGGWNEMAYVAAEVKDPNRNIVRALVLGTTAVTIVYLLLNGAFLYTLGYAGVAASEAVATDTVSTVFPQIGGRWISALVCISALGAVNGLIFTGARISYAVGTEHRVFRTLGQWNSRTGTPVWALAVQGLLAVGLIVALGSFVNTILYTTPAVYSFYLATTVAVIVLRWREPNTKRPYRVTGYPATPLVFGVVCAFLIYAAVEYAVDHQPRIAAISLLMMCLGFPVYWLSTFWSRQGAS
jgi:amino acid transporter